MIAVVLGGAACVWSDLERLSPPEGSVFLAVNDMIAGFPGSCHAVTHHPRTRLHDWLRARELKGHPRPERVWAPSLWHGVTDVVKELNGTRIVGSSGLLAAVAGADRLGLLTVLCGVPMLEDGGHFLRGISWYAATGFRARWLPHIGGLSPRLRSMSGWTMDQFGFPAPHELED